MESTANIPIGTSAGDFLRNRPGPRAQPIDGGVDAVIDVHKSFRRPKLLPELLPGDDLARMFQQKFQNLKRLLLELELHPLFAQLASLQIGFESAKTQHAIFSNLG